MYILMLGSTIKGYSEDRDVLVNAWIKNRHWHNLSIVEVNEITEDTYKRVIPEKKSLFGPITSNGIDL